MKRFICILFSLLLICATLPLSAIAADEDPVYPAGTVVDEDAVLEDEPAPASVDEGIALAAAGDGLNTYTTTNGTSYTLKPGLTYDYEVESSYFQYGTALGQTKKKGEQGCTFLSTTKGPTYFGVLVRFNDDMGDTSLACATDIPTIQCWVDGVLYDDGVKPKAAYQKMEAVLGHKIFGVMPGGALQRRHDFLDVTDIIKESSNSVNKTVTEGYSFEISKMALGKHTIRFFINPEHYEEEVNPENNDVTFTFYIREAAPDAPEAPVVERTASTSITVQAEDGQEYSIDNGLTWQPSGTFTGLTPDTTYQIVARYAETETLLASAASSPISATTTSAAPDTPEAPVLEDLTAVSITVKAVAGLEYSIDNGLTWQDEGVFPYLKPNTSYSIRCRVKAADDTPCSEMSEPLTVKTPKKAVGAPNAPVLVSKTDTTITIKAN